MLPSNASVFFKHMKKYSIIFLLLLVTEIAIGLFHFHKWIRYYLGDLLIIPLLYCLVRMTTTLSKKISVAFVLLIAFASEISQFFKLNEFLNITNKVLLLLIGNSYDIKDIIAYILGVIPIYLIEKHITDETN